MRGVHILLLSIAIGSLGLATSLYLFMHTKTDDENLSFKDFDRFCSRKGTETFQQLQGGMTVLQAMHQYISELPPDLFISNERWKNAVQVLVNKVHWDVTAISNLRWFATVASANSWASRNNVSLHDPVLSEKGNVVPRADAFVIVNSYTNNTSVVGVDYFRSSYTLDITNAATTDGQPTVSKPFFNPARSAKSVLILVPQIIGNRLNSGVAGLYSQDVMIIDRAAARTSDGVDEVAFQIIMKGGILLEDEFYSRNPFVTHYNYTVGDALMLFSCSAPFTPALTPYVILALGAVLSVLVPTMTTIYLRQLRNIQEENLARTAAEATANEARVGEAIAIQAAEVKSTFLNNVSHELRTPLNGIRGNADFLLDTQLSEEQRMHALGILQSTRDLVNIVDDILNYTSMQYGTALPPPNITALNLTEMLFRLPQTFAAELASKHNTLVVVPLQEELRHPIMTDGLFLHQILRKLVENAIKFTDNGTVTVCLQLQNDAEGHSTTVQFHIEDTGVGISSHQQVFVPFMQHESNRSRRFGGTGLGLVITKKLVEHLGGRIEFTSKVNYGSRFSFTIPFLPAPASAISMRLSTSLSSVSSGRQNKLASGLKTEAVQEEEVVLLKEPQLRQILIVEDNMVNMMVAQKTLAKLGYRWLSATNGEQAVQVMKERGSAVDAILMDISMPVMDGLEATRIIRASGTQTPIIAVTANALDSERTKCFAVGMNSFLTKPLSREKLADTLLHLLP